MPTYTPVTVVPSGGAPFVQVSGNAPPMTVVPNAVPITLVTANAPPVVLYNPDGSPYSTDPFPQTSAILGVGGLDYAFYDSGLASSLFQDAAGTIPSVINDPVGRWNVRQKPPHFASQAVSNQRPSLQADGVKFDGVAQNLLTDWFAQAGANCIIAQVTVPAVIGAGFSVIGGSSDANPNRFFIGFDPTTGILAGGVGTISPTTLRGVTDFRGQSIVVALSFDGTTVRLFAGGAQEFSMAQGAAIPNTTVPVRIGANNGNGTPANPFGGSVKRIAFGKTAPTSTQMQQINAEWLAAA